MSRHLLYSFRRCPYAIRARWSLIKCGIKVEIREVSLSNKPKELIDTSPKGTVPVLVTTKGEIIDESIDIMRWALLNSTNSLYSESFLGNINKDSSKLIAQNDNDFKYHLDRYKYSNRYREDSQIYHFSQAKKILTGLNSIIKYNQENYRVPFLNREETLTDWALWPFIRQFRMVNSEEFDNDIDLKSILTWLNIYTEDPSYLTVMHKYCQWKRGDNETYFPIIN